MATDAESERATGQRPPYQCWNVFWVDRRLAVMARTRSGAINSAAWFVKEMGIFEEFTELSVRDIKRLVSDVHGVEVQNKLIYLAAHVIAYVDGNGESIFAPSEYLRKYTKLKGWD